MIDSSTPTGTGTGISFEVKVFRLTQKTSSRIAYAIIELFKATTI
jgi:hypothetical protein